MKKSEQNTVTIRVSEKTNSILNAAASRLQVERPGKGRITQDEVIRQALEVAFPEAVAFIEGSSPKPEGKPENN